jgi:hypothetical protein
MFFGHTTSKKAVKDHINSSGNNKSNKSLLRCDAVKIGRLVSTFPTVLLPTHFKDKSKAIPVTGLGGL